jgi:hypothetical protein
MTDQRTLDRLMDHLRGQVAELRRREGEGAAPEEIAERRRLILRLQERLSYVVRDLLNIQGASPIDRAGSRVATVRSGYPYTSLAGNAP